MEPEHDQRSRANEARDDLARQEFGSLDSIWNLERPYTGQLTLSRENLFFRDLPLAEGLPDSRDRIRSLARDKLTKFSGIECRLGQDDSVFNGPSRNRKL